MAHEVLITPVNNYEGGDERAVSSGRYRGLNVVGSKPMIKVSLCLSVCLTRSFSQEPLTST